MPVSLIIVSQGRPEWLGRCLQAVEQLDHANFEVVVVADEAGLAAAGRGARIKGLRFEEANISAARNRGLALAAGEVVAFIDDDAVPRPDWLRRLAAPFAAPQVVASTGYVIGRNGFSYQYKGREITRRAEHLPLEVPPEGAVLSAPAGRAVKTEGTNMAFRRAALAAAGGFDEAYRFYLDDSDVNLRLAGPTSVIPAALVHHGFAASARRRADRVPQDLSEIGASLAVWMRRRGFDGAECAAFVAAQRAEQQARLDSHLLARRIGPDDVQRLSEGFEAGLVAGAERPLPDLVPLPEAAAPFLPFIPACTGAAVSLAGRPWQARRLRAEARAAVAAGGRAELYLFWPDPRRHQRRFDQGVWEQEGGLFGRSQRSDPAWTYWRFGRRLARELGDAPLCAVKAAQGGG